MWLITDSGCIAITNETGIKKIMSIADNTDSLGHLCLLHGEHPSNTISLSIILAQIIEF